MNLAVNTDFLTGTGSPEPRLRAIAEAGFTHLHWCHQWNTDFLYGKAEIAAIRHWMREFNLKLLDIHGSDGVEKRWYSTVEYERQAGVELVRNRLAMFTELEGSGALMMHIPCFCERTTAAERPVIRARLDALRRSLDELMPELETQQTRIAVENMWGDHWEAIDELLAAYPAERLGICYDSGHANSQEFPQLELLAAHSHRLMALHLHDNDGRGDLHQPPFMGTVDWPRLAEILRQSSYPREISFEISIRNTAFFRQENAEGQPSPEAIRTFLADACERCRRFAAMVRK